MFIIKFSYLVPMEVNDVMNVKMKDVSIFWDTGSDVTHNADLIIRLT